MLIKTKSIVLPLATVTVFVVMIAVTLSLFTYASTASKKVQDEANVQVKELYAQQLLSLTEVLGRQIKNPLYNLEVSEIEGSFQEFLKDDTALYTLAVEPDGSLLKEAYSSELDLKEDEKEGGIQNSFKPFLKMEWKKLSKDSPHIEKRDNKEQILVISPVQIEGSLIGFVAACYTTKKLVATFSNTQKKVEESQAGIATKLNLFFASAAFVVIILGVVLFTVLKISILAPIMKVKEVAHSIATGDGDLTIRMALKRKDEIGDLASGIDSMLENLAGMISKLKQVSSDVKQVGSEVSTTSLSLANEGEEMNKHATSLSSCVSDSATEVGLVAKQADDLSESATVIAGTVEAFQQSIGELSNNASTASSIATEASSNAQKISLSMDSLKKANTEISDVVEIITEITAQTKLLALNATIEAASAGEAGKGFAVVAQEVKDLSGRTQDAADAITEKIATIQSISSQVEGEITHQDEVIGSVSEVSTSIASAVEEQSVTIQEISDRVSSMSGVAQNLSGSSQKMLQSNQEVTNVADILTGTVKAVKENSESGKLNSGNLQTLADDLSQEVGHFKV